MNRQMDEKLRKDFDFCRRVQKRYGKSYYFATKLFPKEIRMATYALYAFFRLPDEIVDSGNIDDAGKNLKQWMAKWQMAYKYQEHEDAVLNASSWVFHKYKIPYEYSESFLNAMLMDVNKKQYASYSELEKYMYGSAAVVGKMMCYVIGFSDDRALKHAEQLGHAMQLTNFLRDIKEDLVLRGRVYLPIDEMNVYQLTQEDLSKGIVSERFVQFMKFQISRTRDLYDLSLSGIPFLNKKGRFPVEIAIRLYSEILVEIENNKFDVFSKRAKISFVRKLFLLCFGKTITKK